MPDAMDVFGIRLVGASHENAVKLGMTVAVIAVLVGVRLLIVGVTRAAPQSRGGRISIFDPVDWIENRDPTPTALGRRVASHLLNPIVLDSG